MNKLQKKREAMIERLYAEVGEEKLVVMMGMVFQARRQLCSFSNSCIPAHQRSGQLAADARAAQPRVQPAAGERRRL